MPSIVEKMKNSAIWRDLNSLKAFSPSISEIEDAAFFSTLHCGNVKHYIKSRMLITADTKNCI